MLHVGRREMQVTARKPEEMNRHGVGISLAE